MQSRERQSLGTGGPQLGGPDDPGAVVVNATLASRGVALGVAVLITLIVVGIVH